MLERNQCDFNSHWRVSNYTHTHTRFLKSLGFILNWALTRQVSDHTEWVEKKLWAVGHFNPFSKSRCASFVPAPCWVLGIHCRDSDMICPLRGLTSWSWRGTTGNAGPVCQFYTISAFHILPPISKGTPAVLREQYWEVLKLMYSKRPFVTKRSISLTI